MSKLMRFGAGRTICAGLFTFAFSQGQALAHVTLEKTEAATGSYQVATIRIGHGCSGSPTVNLRIEIPEGPESVRPQPKPGWTLAVEKQGERVSAILWTGRLEDDQFDQFGVMLKLPAAPGRLYFPTVQRCEAGENDWTMIPAAGQSPHALKSPAPMLELTPAEGMPMDHMHM